MYIYTNISSHNMMLLFPNIEENIEEGIKGKRKERERERGGEREREKNSTIKFILIRKKKK